MVGVAVPLDWAPEKSLPRRRLWKRVRQKLLFGVRRQLHDHRKLEDRCGSRPIEPAASGAADELTYFGRNRSMIAVRSSETSSNVDPRFSRVSTKRDGSGHFEKGLVSFRKNAMSDALGSLELRVPQSRTMLSTSIIEQWRCSRWPGPRAHEALQQAVELELNEPIKNWGMRMALSRPQPPVGRKRPPRSGVGPLATVVPKSLIPRSPNQALTGWPRRACSTSPATVSSNRFWPPNSTPRLRSLSHTI